MFTRRLELKLKKRNMLMTDYIIYMVKEMFNVVGAKDVYTYEYTQQPDWFLQYEWTIDQQNSYIDWLVADLRSMKITKRDSINFASKFVWNYGWKLIKKEETDE